MLHFAKNIDQAIRQKTAFALYREPGQDTALFVTGTLLTLRTLGELKERQGFVVAPFALGKQPLFFLQGQSEAHKLESLEAHRAEDFPFSELPSADYEQSFQSFLHALQAKRFSKLVLSRTQRFAGSYSPGMTFVRACQLYPHAMVSLFSAGEGKVWLGASPEILVAGEGQEWKTMALAGTRPLEEKDLPWDEKNRQEQAYVADYIRQLLTPACSELRESQPYSSPAGKVCHLRSDFTFTPLSQTKLVQIIEALHPTPAVCGLPKQEAQDFILSHEAHDRALYSGFLGPWGSRIALYVNLRCMEMSESDITLYAGGGILPASTLQSEWRETCLKMRTMLSLLDRSCTL